MLQRRRLARAAVCAVAATASLALASPAWATPGNPPGDNGTVKLDGVEFTDKVDNEPHVDCDFELEFFNFDKGQKADITLTAQPPSGPKDKVVKALTDQVISDDDAGGAQPDHDAVIKLSAKDLDLAGLEAHPKQGYHIKLTVDLADGNGKAKHKVFWLQPCETPTTPPPPPPGDGDGDEKDDDENGSLPVTGVAAGGIALGGLALVGTGATLLVLRRRRNITFES